MGTVDIRVPARQISEFSTISVSSALRHSPSARCVSAVNDKQIFGHLTKTLSLLRSLNICIQCIFLFCFFLVQF
jgi:hypothetical protein